MGRGAKDNGLLYLILILLIIGLGIYFYKKKSSIQLNKDICMDYAHISLNGVVDSCFFDYQNKGTFTFKLRANEMYYVFPAAVISHPENFLNKGDSIVKKQGESKYNIYKNSNPDSLVVLSFDCDYWEKGYGKE